MLAILRQVRDELPDAWADAAGAQAGDARLESGDCLRQVHLLCRLPAYGCV